MILQALYEYAQRKGNELPEDGFENAEIKYLIEINDEGSFVTFRDTQEKDEKGKLRGTIFEHVPQVKHTNSTKAFLLLDNFGYILLDEKKIKAYIEELEKAKCEIGANKGLDAVLKFYKENRANGFEKVFDSEFCIEHDLKKLSSTLLTFVLTDENNLIVQDSDLISYYRKSIQTDSEESGDDIDIKESICLVTGEKSTIARTHVKLSSICEKQSPLVSFNKDSFLSYGKKQSYNAPVSMKANYGYTKALNYLVNNKDAKNNRFRLGNDTVVFWADKETAEDFESDFGSFFSLANVDNPDKNVLEVKNLFNAINSGKFRDIDSNFFVLGLSPNASRMSVRFWETGKVETFADRIKQHFEDFEIIKPIYDNKEYLTLFDILSSTALGKTPKEKMDNVAPNLIGNMMQSILKGLPYPATLQQQCIRRIRAEQKITRERAAILKAYINRINRINGKEGVTVSLNRECQDKGYLIGRLFAVLEKVQQDTHPGLNATITDRYYGAASTNPVTVFAQLLKLNQHHLANYENKGLKVIREKEIGEIMSMIESFPSHLTFNEQSMFAIGYYHEKQSFFEKKETEDSTEENKL